MINKGGERRVSNDLKLIGAREQSTPSGAPPPTSDILRLSKVSCWRGENKTSTLHEVSLSVRSGEWVALIGASGSGKTTTLRVIAGFEERCVGHIHIGDQLVMSEEKMIPPERRGVGFVFQEYALFPHLTVKRNIEFGLASLKRQVRETRIREMLEAVDLMGLESRYPHQLSGGQQQRVALARALAPRPSLLLLDEPFSHLDSQLRTSLRDRLMTQLRALGVTVIWVTHDQREALSISDRVIVMDAGRVVANDSPRALYLHPPSPFIASFLGEIDWVEGDVRSGVLVSSLGQFTEPDLEDGEYMIGVRPHLWGLTLRDSTPKPREPQRSARIESVIFEGPSLRLQVRLEGISSDLSLSQRGEQSTVINIVVLGESEWKVGDLIWIEYIGVLITFSI